MAEYIEREEAEKRLFQRAEIANSAYIDQTPYQIMMLAQNVVHLIPAADVQPVRHGRWIPHMESIETAVITASRVYEKGYSVQYGFTCSECGRWEENREPFCNCGAKMDKEEE